MSAGPSAAEPYTDSRRLTGANLYFDGSGAALDVAREPAPGLAFDAEAATRWRGNIDRVRMQLGWPAGACVVRWHDSGASLAFEAPIDQLYAATEANEWALHAALGLRAGAGSVAADDDPPRSHPAHFDDATALAELKRLAGAEARPALGSLLDAARARGLPAHLDDEALTLGEGARAQTWPTAELPALADVCWAELARVPKALVTGSNGKTTTVRLLAAMLRATGVAVGYSSTDGLFVEGQALEAGDYSGPVGARTILRDGRVQAAVLETARGGLLRRGLAVADADVAVVTNVAPDHFGEYGIDNLDDLADAKLVVARGLATGGLLVLNATVPALLQRARVQRDQPHRVGTPGARPGRRTAWFAARLDPALAQGLPASGMRDGHLWLVDADAEHDLGEVAAMPLSAAGQATYNIENMAAAALAAHGMGVAPARIAACLARFGADNADNPGRLQRWSLGGAVVLLDYAHNADGLRGLLHVAQGLRGGDGRLGLLLGHAGNRLPSDFQALAQVAAQAHPDRVWLKDIGGDYLRGRASGEVAALLGDALQDAGMARDALPICLDEALAARQALAWARPGDVLVLPIHELQRRDEVLALLDGLQAHGWQPGDALPD